MNSNLVRWGLLIVLILLLVGGGIFAFLHFTRHGGDTTGPVVAPGKPKPLTAAELLPADTFILLRMPDAPRAAAKFKASPAFTLMTDPGVVESWKQAGVKKNADGEPEPVWEGWPQFLALVTGLAELADGEAFVAITNLREEERQPKASGIAGLRVTGDDAAVGAWLEQVRAIDPQLEWKAVPDVLHSYYTAVPRSDKPDEVLCAARMEQWIFFGLDPKLFESVLARAAESTRQPGSLADEARFTQTLIDLNPDPDLFTYINFAPMIPLLGKAIEAGKAMQTAAETDDPDEDGNGAESAAPATLSPEVLEKLKMFQGLAMTTSLSGSDWLDGMRFLVATGNTAITAAMRTPLSGVTSRYAGRDALVCMVGNTDFPGLLNQLKEGNPEMADQVDQVAGMADGFLSAAGLTLQGDILDNLGPETTTVIEWAPGSPLPTVLSALQHRKQEPLKKALDFLATSAAAFGGLVQVESTLVGSDPAYTVSSPLAPVPPLTIYLGSDALVMGFNAGKPDTLAARQGPGLLGSPDYLALKERLGPPAIKEPVQVIYVDLRRLYANVHGALGTWLPMIPGIDASTVSLPTPDAVEPYLGRTLWLSQIEGDTVTSSSVTEKVHCVFLLAASVGWLAEMGSKMPGKTPGVAEDENGMFEAEILETETVEGEAGMTPALPSEPEPIFDNVPQSPPSPEMVNP